MDQRVTVNIVRDETQHGVGKEDIANKSGKVVVKIVLAQSGKVRAQRFEQESSNWRLVTDLLTLSASMILAIMLGSKSLA
jgi:hypothetical protein